MTMSERRWKANRQQFFGEFAIYPFGFEFDHETGNHAASEHGDHDGHIEDLRDDRANRGALNTECREAVVAEDQAVVESNVESVGGQSNHEGKARVADAPTHRAVKDHQVVEGRTDHQRAEVLGAERGNLGIGAKRANDLLRAEIADRPHSDADQDGELRPIGEPGG